MKVFLSWLRARLWTLAFPAACLVVCAVVFGLYQLPLCAVGYAALLCGVLALLWMALDFLLYARRHRCLTALQKEIDATLAHLPEPRDLLDTDWCALIRTLDEAKRDAQAEGERRYTATVEYFTVWVHQIKTPIAAMRLLLQETDTPENRALSEELMRIEQYVEMVLGYLRLDSDSTDYVLRRCELDAIVRQSVRKYAALFIRKKIRLDYQSVNCAVLTDEKWLAFVIEQILSNALKYTRSGSVTIRLEAPCTLVIADTGIGIPPDELPRVFERGYTGCNGRTDKRATGLGLYLCKRILTQLGHGIDIRSAPGAGTAVRICLEEHDLEVE